LTPVPNLANLPAQPVFVERIMNRVWLAAALTLALGVAARSAGAQAPAAPDGAALYRQNCRSCHGARGKPSEQMRGVYPSLVTLSDSAVQAELTVDGVAELVAKGNGKNMKPFADRLSADEIHAVAAFVKGLKPAADAP
jgi:mono/diheme cytochrome c family protein